MNESDLFECDVHVVDKDDRGERVISKNIITGIEVKTDFVVGPYTIRRLNADIDDFPPDARKDTQFSVMEFAYIDRCRARSLYCEPFQYQMAAVKTLQLLVDNWVGTSAFFHFDEKTREIIGSVGSARNETADGEFYKGEAVLESSETNRELFKKIFTVTTIHLKGPVDRFSRGCTEVKEECILDFVIALEGTLGYGLSSEIARTLSCRGAMLLADDDSKRELYYKLFKQLYDLRSKIAHGGTVSDNQKRKFLNLSEELDYWSSDCYDSASPIEMDHGIADVVRKITRNVLLAFIENPALLDENELLRLELGLKKPRSRD